MHRRHRDIDRLINHLACAIHHHHRPVIQIRNALIVFLALTQNKNAHRLARQHHRLQRIGELVHIHDLDALQRRHLVQVEIVRNDFRVITLRQLDKFQIHFRNAREIIFRNLHFEVRHLLHPLQHFEPAPPALPL